MSSKKSKKSNKSDETKRNVQTQEKAPERYSKEEIISEEELDNRIAIDGDIRLYLTMHLRIFIDGYFHHPKKKKLINMVIIRILKSMTNLLYQKQIEIF